MRAELTERPSAMASLSDPLLWRLRPLHYRGDIDRPRAGEMLRYDISFGTGASRRAAEESVGPER